MDDIYGIFHSNFNILSADSEELVEQVFRLRYQVYCVENEFENPLDYKDGRETDAYDSRSLHSLIKHQESGLFAGVVRLILPDGENPESEFPIETACKSLFDEKILSEQYFPRETMAEISRFAVSKQFKQRITEECHGCTRTAEEQQGRTCQSLLLPHIPIGLFAACVRMAADSGITHWYAVMEPIFIRFLSRFGIQFQPVGPAVDYHGMRVPCYTDIDEMMSQIYRVRPDIWEVMSDYGRVWPLNPYVARALQSKTGY